MWKITIAGVLALTTTSTALAETTTTIVQSQSAPYSSLNNVTPNSDHWGIHSLKADEGKLRKQVSQSSSGQEWARAREAAAAINANRCGEAAAIAAEARDARLMAGVKRACGAATQS